MVTRAFLSDMDTMGFYTGGNDIEVDAVWVWNYPSGVELSYSNWSPGEPHNAP